VSRTKKLVARLLLAVIAFGLTDCLSLAVLSKVWGDRFFQEDLDELLASLSSVQDFLDPAEPAPDDALAIGIFGGSVAGSFGDHVVRALPSLEVVSDWEARTGRQVIVRSLGYNGIAQPGPYNQLHLHAPVLDVAVFLDGFNEATFEGLPSCESAEAYWRSHDRDAAEAFAPLRDDLESLHAMAHRPLYRLLRYSALFRAYLRHLDTAQPAANVEFMVYLGIDEERGDDELLVSPTEGWVDCVRRSAEYAESEEIHAFFFLQPNQHVASSKPFSDAELRIFDDPLECGPERSARHEAVDGIYADMRAAIPELVDEGVGVFDLSWLFREVGETLYADCCCHFNRRGNERLADEILGTVLSAVE